MNKQYLNRSYRLQSLVNGRKSQSFTDQREDRSPSVAAWKRFLFGFIISTTKLTQ